MVDKWEGDVPGLSHLSLGQRRGEGEDLQGSAYERLPRSPSPAPELFSFTTWNASMSPSPSPSDPPPNSQPLPSPKHEGQRPAGPEPLTQAALSAVKAQAEEGSRSSGTEEGGAHSGEGNVADGRLIGGVRDVAECESKGGKRVESAGGKVSASNYPDIGRMYISTNLQPQLHGSKSPSPSPNSKAHLFRRRAGGGVNRGSGLKPQSLQMFSEEESAKTDAPGTTVLMPWPKIVDKDYRCLCSCGSGSFGEVYKAIHRVTSQVVAVKVMESDKWALQEASMLRELSHECICKLYEYLVSEDEGVACLVMQYASGGDLLERIVSTGPLTEKVTAAIAEHLLHALDHMHSKGVIHRDLKPENVLFANESCDRPLLADFGVGKRLGQEEEEDEEERNTAPWNDAIRTHSRHIGTVGYSAPEVNSDAGHSFKADVWSFGAMIYVLLCGYHPFDMGDDPEDVIEEGAGWKYISEEARDFVRRCLIVDVKERVSVSDCLKHAWLQKDFMDVVELSEAFVRLKVYHSSRREYRSLQARVSASRLKRKRESSAVFDEISSGGLTPTPSVRAKKIDISSNLLPTTMEASLVEMSFETEEARQYDSEVSRSQGKANDSEVLIPQPVHSSEKRERKRPVTGHEEGGGGCIEKGTDSGAGKRERRSQCQAPGPLPSKWSASERPSGAGESSTPHETFTGARGMPRGENEEEGPHSGNVLSRSCAGVVNASSVQSSAYPNAVQSASAHSPGCVPDYLTSHQPGPDASEQNFSPAGREVTQGSPVIQPFTPSNILEWQTPPGKILRTITPGVSPALQPFGSPTDSLLSAHSSSLSGLSLGPSARQASSWSTSTKMPLKRPQQALHKPQTVPMQHSHKVKAAVPKLQGHILDQDVISVSGRVGSGEVSPVDELSASPERSSADMCAESERLLIASTLFESGGLSSVVESGDSSIVGVHVDAGILLTARQETGGGDGTWERPSSVGGEDSQKRKREPSAELSGERPVSRQIQKYPEAE